jgi:hypothetical protein
MLGNAAMSSEDYTSARGYFVESLQVAEELGQTRDMVGLLLEVANTLAAAGDVEQAIEMAATAFAHPASAQNTTFAIKSTRDRAEALRASTASEIGPETVEVAWERGLAADFDGVVVRLIESAPKEESASFS